MGRVVLATSGRVGSQSFRPGQTFDEVLDAAYITSLRDLGATFFAVEGSAMQTALQQVDTARSRGASDLQLTLILWGVVARPMFPMLRASSDETENSEALAAYLEANPVVELAPETFKLAGQISIPSGRTIFSRSYAKIIPYWNSVLGPSTRTNSVFMVKGTERADLLSTTLGADVFFGTKAFTLTGVALDASWAGKWVRVKGSNPQADFAGDSSANTVSEVNQISTSFAGAAAGQPIATTYAWKMHHDVLQAVIAIEPPSDTTIDGVYVDSIDNPTIAAALHVEDSVRIVGNRIAGRHLSRAIVSTYGAKEIRTDTVINRGSSNATLVRETTQGGYFRNTHRTSEGTRTHELGYPMHELSMRAHCVSCLDDGGYIEQSIGLARMWGGIGCGVSNFVANDLLITEALERDPEGDPVWGAGNGSFGIVLDMGPPRVPQPEGPPAMTNPERSAEFSFGNWMSNVHATNVRARAKFGAVGGGQPALYFHDSFRFKLSNITVENIGLDPTAVGGHPCSGIIMSDCSGTLESCTLRGVDLGLLTRNVRNNVTVDGLVMAGAGGIDTDSIGGPAFYFDHDGGKFCSPIFGSVVVSNFGGNGVTDDFIPVRFGPGWDSNPDHDMQFNHLQIDGLTYRDVRPVKSFPFSFGPTPPDGGPFAGQVGTFRASGAQPPEVAVATGPDARNFIYASFPSTTNGWCLGAFGPVDAYVPAGTKLGDFLVAGANGFLALAPGNVPPAYPAKCFRVVGQYSVAYGKALVEPFP